jgi:hypothetical protein
LETAQKNHAYMLKIMHNSTSSLIRPLPSKVTPLIRSDFKCTEIVKYYSIGPLKREHLSSKDTPQERTPL